MILEQDLGLVWLTGELSNLAMPSSGHWYFSLKDISAQVRCAMFKGNNRRVPFRPQDGMQVLVQARVSLYEPRGDYQLIIESMQPAARSSSAASAPRGCSTRAASARSPASHAPWGWSPRPPAPPCTTC